jgi:hypothetical protein
MIDTKLVERVMSLDDKDMAYLRTLMNMVNGSGGKVSPYPYQVERSAMPEGDSGDMNYNTWNGEKFGAMIGRFDPTKSRVRK